MADLKAGTTVAGSALWHQGNFPLFPAGNSLTYRGFKVYTENDKPQAVDNDFVSKASGGVYLARVTFDNSNASASMPRVSGVSPGFQLDVKAGSNVIGSHQLLGGQVNFVYRNNLDGTFVDRYRWNQTTLSFEVNGSVRFIAGSGGAYYDSTGAQVYSPQNRPTPAAIGAVALDAVVDFGTY